MVNKVAAALVVVSALCGTGAIADGLTWGDVNPTQEVNQVVQSQGLAPISTISNLVEGVLAPRDLEFNYDSSNPMTNNLVAPIFATSKLVFVGNGVVRGDVDDGKNTHVSVANLYSAGSLRNYSVVIDDIPKDMGYITMSFHELSKTHTIYATPELGASKHTNFTMSWDMEEGDVPCVVTVRESTGSTLILTR